LAIALRIASRYFVAQRQSKMDTPDDMPNGENLGLMPSPIQEGVKLRGQGLGKWLLHERHSWIERRLGREGFMVGSLALGIRTNTRLVLVLALIGAGLLVLESRPANAAKVGTISVAPVVLPSPAEAQGAGQGSPARPAARVGQLMVSANVKGAKITVDGRSDPRWLTPFTIPGLSAGAHDVVISLDGYASYQQTVTVASGQTANVVANLSPRRAEFGVETDPPGVEILIDGKSYGPSPVHATLDPGNHTYVVKQQGVAPYENTFSIKSGEVVAKKLILGDPSGTGLVQVKTIPDGATVEADEAVVGEPTPTSFRLPVGSHTLTISLAGYEPVQQQVTVSASASTPVNVTLSNEPPAAGTRNAEIRIETMPAGIEILIDGKSYGPSPVRVTLSPGDHTYTVKPPGLAPYQNAFTVKPGEIIVKKLTLQPTAGAPPAAPAPPHQQ
jgi:hypothetical protein